MSAVQSLTSLQLALLSHPAHPPPTCLLVPTPADAVEAIMRVSSVTTPAARASVDAHFAATAAAHTSTAASARRIDAAIERGGAVSGGLGAALLAAHDVGSVAGLAYHTHRELLAGGLPRPVAGALAGLFWKV